MNEASAVPLVMAFLKAPRVNLVKRRLAGDIGNERAIDVYRGMVERQLRQVPRGWTVEIHFAPENAEEEMRSWLGPNYRYVAQTGEDFGARLKNGFARAFASGRTHVLAMAGDCPELDTATLFEVMTRLHRADLVLGPANDGGLYLVALHRPAGELFERIPWGTPNVLSLVLARAKISGISRELLTPKDDIDDAATYRGYLQRVATESSSERMGVVISALNNAATIGAVVDAARQAFLFSPLVVVDGGSTDGTVELAAARGAQVISAARSRGRQRRVGASAVANADWLLFLHADCILPGNAQALVAEFIEQPRAQVATFRLQFDSPSAFLRTCAWFTRVSTPCTRFGNQGILIRRAFYEALGGFPEWALFEDVELLRRARAVAPIRVLRGAMTAAAHRFDERGPIRAQWLNARLLSRLMMGSSAGELAQRYFTPVNGKARSATGIAPVAAEPLRPPTNVAVPVKQILTS